MGDAAGVTLVAPASGEEAAVAETAAGALAAAPSVEGTAGVTLLLSPWLILLMRKLL